MSPQVQGLNSQNRREGPQKVFVYGTLKKNHGNHMHYLLGCKDLGVATVEGIMFHLGGCPAINLGERLGPIHGEVYEVDWDHIIELDRLEGVNSGFYDRIEARVTPHGVVWMYVFPRDRAAREQYVVPSGIWRGRDTPRVKWSGFGKGIEVGSFEASSSPSTIKVGTGPGTFELRRSAMDQSYKLLDKRTGEVLGSYVHLRDMVGTDGKTKPVLRLPAKTTEVTVAVKSILGPDGNPLPQLPPPNPTHIHPNHPILWAERVKQAVEEEKEEQIPQAARLLGIKYGEA